LQVELEIWISDAQRVRRPAVPLWSEAPGARGGGRTEGLLLVVRDVNAAAAPYTRRSGEGLAGREDEVYGTVAVCAKKMRDKGPKG
jgi:hypothetical protein